VNLSANRTEDDFRSILMTAGLIAGSGPEAGMFAARPLCLIKTLRTSEAAVAKSLIV